MKNLKNHSFFVTAFSITTLIFLYPLIFMRSSFLGGDYFVQFYPWLKCYSEAVKNFSFPYWISSMGTGFPLMAEGQIAGFYPLNILLFFLLPLRVAYNYSIVMHFVIAEIFIYLYARKVGANQIGGYVASLLFCFGSAYAGCFYNIGTLRTLVWFPLVLLLFEHYFNRRNMRYILFSGIILGIQLLAGFIQMAAYSALFYLIYFVYRARSEKIGIKDALFAPSIFMILSFIIALPQLILTYQLSSFSGREHATLGFALWRSFLPTGLLGLVFPYSLSSIGSHFYVGVLSILFITFSIIVAKKSPLLKAMILILIASLFFALGWFNPIYVIILRITGFYFFRNPSKFLFFGVFALSVLAGWGFTQFFENGQTKQTKKTISLFRRTILYAGFAFLLVKLLITVFKTQVLEAGYYIAKNFIYNRPHHRYSLEYYMDSINSFYNSMLEGLAFSNIFVLCSWALIIISILTLPFLFKKRMKFLCIAVIFFDLFVFSSYGIGFSGNIKPFAYLAPDNPKILRILKNDPEPCRILPFDLKSGKLPNWSLPNANVMYGLDSITCYTPLVGSNYREILSGLEVVDDSLGMDIPREEVLDRSLDIIRLLNVKYIISGKKLNKNYLRQEALSGGVFLYRLKGYYPKVFFSDSVDWDVKPLRIECLEIVESSNGYLELKIKADKKGFIVFSENYYPGWHAYVDGQEEEIIKVKGLVQGVAVREGEHKVRFVYKPYGLTSKR